MTEDEQTVLMIQGAIANLPTEDRERAETLYNAISAMIIAAGPVGVLVLARLGAELQAQQ